MHYSLDHIGYAVANIDEEIQSYQKLFSLSVSHREVLTDRGIEIAFLDLSNTKIELLSPVNGMTNVLSAFLAKRGPGMHHVCYSVKDIRAELKRLASLGVVLIDEEPRPGAHGTIIAFLHPKSTRGVLTELCEYTTSS